MAVYFIQAGPNGPVKIGRAANPPARLAELQGANHEELRLLRVIPGNETTERALHGLYAHLRIRGEWFRFDASMLTVSAIEHDRSWRPLEEHWAAIRRAAYLAGVERETVKKWRQRGVIPPRWHTRLSEIAAHHAIVLPTTIFRSGIAA